MISNPRHGLPPRLMAHQPTRFATAQESKPSPSSGIRITCRLIHAVASRVVGTCVPGPSQGPNPGLETPALLNSGWWAFHRAGPERRRVDERCLGRFRRWPGAAEGLRSARLRRRPPVAVDAVLAIAGARHEPGIFRFRQTVA